MKVSRFTTNGTTYLKSSENILYDISSHDVVGKWCEEKNEIVKLEEYEEEEEEYEY